MSGLFQFLTWVEVVGARNDMESNAQETIRLASEEKRKREDDEIKSQFRKIYETQSIYSIDPDAFNMQYPPEQMRIIIKSKTKLPQVTKSSNHWWVWVYSPFWDTIFHFSKKLLRMAQWSPRFFGWGLLRFYCF